MAARNSGKALKKRGNDSNSSFASLEKNSYEGERLTNLLQSMRRVIRSSRHLDANSLPEKIWLKQQFSIGVNEVTRVLERMTPCAKLQSSPLLPRIICSNHKASSVKLQAVLIASDCNPRWLTKHLPSLALSRNVPLLFFKDNKEGSLRFGELVKLKTAIAVGVKAKESTINKFFEEILQGDEFKPGPDWPNSAGIANMRCDVQESDGQRDM